MSLGTACCALCWGGDSSFLLGWSTSKSKIAVAHKARCHPERSEGSGMDPHDHRDASLALSVTCAMLLRSGAENPDRDASLRSA